MKRLFLLAMLVAPVALNAMFTTTMTQEMQENRWANLLGDIVDEFNQGRLTQQRVFSNVVDATWKDSNLFAGITRTQFRPMMVRIRQIVARWGTATPQERENALAGLMFLIDGYVGVAKGEAESLYQDLSRRVAPTAAAAAAAASSATPIAPGASM